MKNFRTNFKPQLFIDRILNFFCLDVWCWKILLAQLKNSAIFFLSYKFGQKFFRFFSFLVSLKPWCSKLPKVSILCVLMLYKEVLYHLCSLLRVFTLFVSSHGDKKHGTFFWCVIVPVTIIWERNNLWLLPSKTNNVHASKREHPKIKIYSKVWLYICLYIHALE